MRFTQCATSSSSILITMDTPHPWHYLRDDVYKVCSGPLIPERWILPVCNQPLLRIRFSQCTMSPLPPPPPLGDEMYLLCSGPLIPDSAWEMKFTQSVQPAPHAAPTSPWDEAYQCATSLSSLLGDKDFSVCNINTAIKQCSLKLRLLSKYFAYFLSNSHLST